MGSSSQVIHNSGLQRHRGPHLGALAIVYTVLFLAGLYPVVTFTAGAPHFPGPWEPADVMVSYFRSYPAPVLLCAFLQFGAAVPLGIFTATIVSRLRFLGIRAAGPYIALFGGFATAFDIMATSHILWAMVSPGIAQDATLLRALYFVSFGLGGPGFSVPFGLLLAGVSVSAGVDRLLPRWLAVAGVLLAAIGELSWLSMVLPQALLLIPLTRFPGFLWLIAAGFVMPAAAPPKEMNRAAA